MNAVHQTYDQLALRRELERDEGRRRTPYRDSLGYWTVGVGHLLTPRERKIYLADDRPVKTLTDAEIDALLVADIRAAEDNLETFFAGWRDLDDARQRALINLSFNLGSKLLQFRRLRAALAAKDWAGAERSLKASLWFKQVKLRGPRIVHALKTGTPWRGA